MTIVMIILYDHNRAALGMVASMGTHDTAGSPYYGKDTNKNLSDESRHIFYPLCMGKGG